ncbi:hypothetical protein ACLB2K_072670 [Fragaria x ananassa]
MAHLTWVWLMAGYSSGWDARLGGQNSQSSHPIGREVYAYFGLLKTGPNGGVAQTLATSAEGFPFCFLNGVDIDQETGMVYFTDTSAIYQRRNWELSVSTGDKTGRFMLYDPSTKNVTVLLHGLAFANGVALSKDGDFVLVTQTTAKNILSAGRVKAVKLDAQGNFLDVVR